MLRIEGGTWIAHSSGSLFVTGWKSPGNVMDGSRYLSYWGSKFAPEFMAGINRNRRQERIAMSGRNSPENASNNGT